MRVADNPRGSTGVVPPPTRGMVMASPRLAGSWAVWWSDDHADHAGVAAGGVLLGALRSKVSMSAGVCHCTLGEVLASAGALCALCGVRPYDRGTPLEADEADGLHRSHIPRSTETGGGPTLGAAD